jgi:hypothetical protein
MKRPKKLKDAVPLRYLVIGAQAQGDFSMVERSAKRHCMDLQVHCKQL